MFLSTKRCKVWTRAACVRAISMASFRVSSFSVRLCTGDMVLRCCKTGATSQISAYLGVDGLRLNTPRSSLMTRGWLPARHPSTTIPNEERAPLAVLTQSYPTPLWKVSDKKFIMLLTEGLRESISHLRQNCDHLLTCVRYCFSVPGFQEAMMISVPVAEMPRFRRVSRTEGKPLTWCVA